ncbi:hypothetical protein [Sphingobium lactosutens]|uniref:DODA-type extradiol aromatic ring-opening family dioxygenase n=1 Tax=Sphingobium lactosutens TaxID=522773 RepID=UPI001C4C8B7D
MLGAYDLPGNPELARLIAEEATAAGVRTSAVEDPYLPIHYPTVNIAHFLNRGKEWLSVSCAQTGETDDFLRVERGVGRAVARSGRRVVLIASGSMSHRFWPLRSWPIMRRLTSSHQPPGSARGGSGAAGMVQAGQSCRRHRNHAGISETCARSPFRPLSDDGKGAGRVRLGGQRPTLQRL